MKILIIGATGNAGSNAIEALKAKGVRPTAAVRDIKKAKAKLGDDTDYVFFDYLDKSTYDAALKGVNKLFFIAPPPKKDPAIARELMEAVQKAGIDFVLFQSGGTSGTYKGKPLYQIEQDLRNSDANICIIRPAWYMQNFHTWLGTTLEDDEICLPTGEAKVAYFDLKDLGIAIAEILTTDGHVDKIYSLTGAKAIGFDEVAAAIGEASGRETKYRDMTNEGYVNKMVEKGWSADAAKYCIWLYDRVKAGSEEEVTGDFKNIVGSEPTSFAEFARREFGQKK
ncbi:MAG: NAD(P)H-binding protein [Chitinophagales bacterium]